MRHKVYCVISRCWRSCNSHQASVGFPLQRSGIFVEHTPPKSARPSGPVSCLLNEFSVTRFSDASIRQYAGPLDRVARSNWFISTKIPLARGLWQVRQQHSIHAMKGSLTPNGAPLRHSTFRIRYSIFPPPSPHRKLSTENPARSSTRSTTVAATASTVCGRE